ncbi:hypothetical protein LAZ67_18001178 [Cordylochernes scorpioides]|uniref:DUF4283 domain-containing protein n=1 Tax=Cordylochernes scorpioides TaxID=51811 RepID=A0ABY6LH04_9ARAC|nr:hypothetical protein LAZ67_18001178 [Cordylochernes scorpioides]
MDKVFLHHDKASSHTSNKTQQFLQEMKDTLGLNFIRNSDIPVKSPDASPLDFYGFVIVAVYACGVDVEKGPIRQQLWNAPPCDNVESWFGAQSRMIPGVLAFIQDADIAKALEPYGQTISIRPLPFPTDNPLLKHLSSLRREVVFKKKDSTDMPALIIINYMNRSFRIYVGEDVICADCRRHGHKKDKCPFNKNIRDTVTQLVTVDMLEGTPTTVPTPPEEEKVMNIPPETKSTSRKRILAELTDVPTPPYALNDLGKRPKSNPPTEVLPKNVEPMQEGEPKEAQEPTNEDILQGLPSEDDFPRRGQDELSEDNESVALSELSVASSQLERESEFCEPELNPRMVKILKALCCKSGRTRKTKIIEQMDKHPNLKQDLTTFREEIRQRKNAWHKVKPDEKKVYQKYYSRIRDLLKTMEEENLT